MHRKTILLVEDNPDDIALTLRALRKNDLLDRVIVAHDGAEAIGRLLGRGGTVDREGLIPQLVLLDLNLPKIDGLDVLRQLRADPRTHRLPVVILTSSREREDVVRSYELGANSYIRKPVDFTKFVDAIGHVGTYWLAINEPPPDVLVM